MVSGKHLSVLTYTSCEMENSDATIPQEVQYISLDTCMYVCRADEFSIRKSLSIGIGISNEKT